jgi:tetratricopeptide (TPR) repeat protein
MAFFVGGGYKKMFCWKKLQESLHLNNQLNDEIIQYKKDIDNLRKKIENLKETDIYYYQYGINEFNNGNFEKAIEWMNKLKDKFPTSFLIHSAEKLIKDSNESEAYIIQSAWLLLHDQPYRKVETKNAGSVIINNNSISYNGQDYVFTDHINSETYLSFTLFFPE